MKRLARLALATALMPILFATFTTALKAEKLEGLEVSRPAQGINFTQSIDTSKWTSYSAQAVYSDGTPSTFSFVSGSRSSATITVNNPTGLIGTQASVRVNIVSTTGVTGDRVVLNGIQFLEGLEWSVGSSTTASAVNLKTIIDAHPDFVATSAGSTVTVKYVLYGIPGNGLPATTTDATNLVLSAATFGSGAERQSFYLNGFEFKEGTNWLANSSSQTTAINISTNINADSRVNTQVSASTTSLGIVTITSLTAGYKEYSLSSSTSALVTSSGFPGGLNSDVDTITDIFTKVNHGLTTGLKVLVATTSLAPPTGLTTGTTYFAIKLNENQYKLATTSTTAAAGTGIDISTVTNGATMDIKPLALSLAANNGFFWQVSNDNSNFSTLTGVTVNGVSVSSVTYAAAGNTTWDFGTLNYRYLRVNFTGPTNGGITLNIRIFGKKD